MPDTAIAETTTANNGTATVTVTQEPAQAAGASASTQVTTGSAGSANGATPTTPAPAAETKASGELPDGWEWNGNVDEVEAPFKKRALGIQRYLTKRSQELAESQRKAQELDRMKSDPNIQAYLQGNQNGNRAQQPQAAPMIAPQEWEQMGIDPAVGQVIDKMIGSRIEAAKAEVTGILSQVDQKQSKLERTQEIQDFGDLHPDMWDLYDAGILGPIVREVVDMKKGTLTDAYTIAKGIRDKFRNEAIQNSQQRVQQKKAAFTSTPSPSSEPDVIWVDNPQDSYRIAFENALQNKRVTVKTKPR